VERLELSGESVAESWDGVSLPELETVPLAGAVKEREPVLICELTVLCVALLEVRGDVLLQTVGVTASVVDFELRPDEVPDAVKRASVTVTLAVLLALTLRDFERLDEKLAEEHAEPWPEEEGGPVPEGTGVRLPVACASKVTVSVAPKLRDTLKELDSKAVREPSAVVSGELDGCELLEVLQHWVALQLESPLNDAEALCKGLRLDDGESLLELDSELLAESDELGELEDASEALREMLIEALAVVDDDSHLCVRDSAGERDDFHDSVPRLLKEADGVTRDEKLIALADELGLLASLGVAGLEDGEVLAAALTVAALADDVSDTCALIVPE
jgi:hypothetical protein